MSRPVLLLDVMDTVVRDPFRDMPGFFGMDAKEMWPLLDPKAWGEFEAARIGQDEFLDRFFSDRRRFDRAGFLRLVSDGFRWIEGMEDLLRDLGGAGTAMHALSNYPCWWEMIEEKLGLSRLLPWTFVSCRTGLRKPAEEAFRLAARTLGLPPTSCVFVDDVGRNCKAAAAVGMDAIRFAGAADLRAQLVRRGLLPGG